VPRQWGCFAVCCGAFQGLVLHCFVLHCVVLPCSGGLKLAGQGWEGGGYHMERIASYRALQPSRGALSRGSCFAAAYSGSQAQD